MRELPKYAILTSTEIPGVKVISLERPYIIASVHDYHRDDERVQERMEDMVQGRYPVAKVKGYAIFLTMYTSLEPCNNVELQTAVLNEMAEFFMAEKISRKPGLFSKSDESGKSEKKFAATKERVMRERRQRERDGKVIGK